MILTQLTQRTTVTTITTIILITILTFTHSIDNNLHAMIISASHTFENYRHSTNSMMMYQYFKKIGIPDHKIIFAVNEAHTCSPRMKFPGKIFLPDSKSKTCQEDLFIDYKETDIFNFRFLDLLRGRYSFSLLKTNIRKLNTNRNSRLLIYITAHGGDTFIKFRGKYVVLSDDLNRALIEMYSKGRYKEILFILDTCEGFTLFTSVNSDLAPNIFFISSSVLNEKALSISYDNEQMTPLADRFSYLLYNIIENVYSNRNFDLDIRKIIEKIQNDVNMKTTVGVLNGIKRKVLFKDYFGSKDLYKNKLFHSKINKRLGIVNKDSFEVFSYMNNQRIYRLYLFVFGLNQEMNKKIDEYSVLISHNRKYESLVFSSDFSSFNTSTRRQGLSVGFDLFFQVLYVSIVFLVVAYIIRFIMKNEKCF